jgi:hypothetical protein
MIRTVYIDDSGEKARAFLKFIQSLDFVISTGKDIVLTDRQKKELDKRRKSALDEDFIPLKEVNKRLKKKYGL